MNNSRNYLLVTACKNEGENLPDLIESVIAQTTQPIVWTIVDDGSTDETPSILHKYSTRYNWINIIRLNESKRDLGTHYAKVVEIGLNNAIQYCNDNMIEYNYFGNLDGDLKLPPTFYENIIKEFEIDSKLGIASGGTDHIIGNKVIRACISVNEPSGGHMLIKKLCLEECGGIPITYSIDSVLKAKARLRNWQTRRFEDNIAVEIRDVSSAEGYWKGKIQAGKSAYYLNFHPMHVIAKSVLYSSIKPYYLGMPYLVGYFNSFLKRSEQIDDFEIKHYFRNKWKEKI